jgi:UDP-N-acetylmuramoylalanine--D-glutamate ligase
LNISADHMDRYADMQAYHLAKHKIFRGCRQVVINRSDSLTRPLLSDAVKVWSFGLGRPDFHGFGILEKDGDEFLAFEFESLMPVSSLKIAGRHNIENALAALAIGRAVGLSFPAMLEVLKEFKGLPHRCQYVAELNAVRFYNDSKGTNVGATVAAISGFESSARKVVLIAGGEGKGADFSPLLSVVKEYCRAVVLLGESAGDLEQLLGDEVSVVISADMTQAVAEAKKLAVDGDVVLLSPACASFDMFENYQHRGNAFAQAVADLDREAC